MFVRTRGRRRRALAAAAVCALAAAAVYVGIASAGGPPSGDHGRGRGPHTYTIGLFGDMPYNALGRQQYPALLQNINDAHVSFSIFDGDLKAGGDGPCSDSLYTTSIAWSTSSSSRSSGCRATTTGRTAGAATARRRSRTPTRSSG
jgi:hypothetical protein